MDTSEGGWATDGTASLIATLFYISSFVIALPVYRRYQLGTAVMFFFGMLNHRHYSNRAIAPTPNGVGQWQYYATSVSAYAGSAYRAAFGYDLPASNAVRAFQCITALAMASLVLSAVVTVAIMRITSSAVDDVPADPTQPAIYVDLWCLASESLLVACEMVGAGFFLANQVALARAAAGHEWWRDTTHVIWGLLVCVLVIVQFGIVYVAGGILTVKCCPYDKGLFQRIFHGLVVCTCWALHTQALVLHLHGVGGDVTPVRQSCTLARGSEPASIQQESPVSDGIVPSGRSRASRADAGWPSVGRPGC